MLIAVSKAKMAAGGVSVRFHRDKSYKHQINIYQLYPFGWFRVISYIATVTERYVTSIETNPQNKSSAVKCRNNKAHLF